MSKEDFKGIKLEGIFGKLTWEFPPELNYIFHFTVEDQKKAAETLAKLCLEEIAVALFAVSMNLNAETELLEKFLFSLRNAMDGVRKSGLVFMKGLNLSGNDENQKIDNYN